VAWVFGQIGGLFTPVGHELYHRRATIHKFTGTVYFVKMLYTHSFIFHMRVHHKLAGLPEDPGTPALTDNIWINYPKAVYGSLVAAWNVEAKRLQGNAFSL
jgi:hypothetical protein